MWFNSFEFWVFFGLVVIGCWRLAHAGRNRLLLSGQRQRRERRYGHITLSP